MSVTLTFYRFDEKKPEHDQEIIWLEGVTSFGAEGFQPRHIRAEYSWFTLDEEGEDDDNQIVYNGETEMEDARLVILLDGYEAKDAFLWMALDDYWTALGLED